MPSVPNGGECTSSIHTQTQGHESVKGVLILGFSPESRAEKAFLRKGDVIIEYDGEGDLTTEKLAVLTAGDKIRGRIRVVYVRDAQEYSLRLKPGPLGISGLDTTIEDSSGLQLAKNKIRRVVRRIQRINMVFAVLCAWGALAALLLSHEIEVVLNGFILAIVYAALYFGIRYRIRGTIPLLLVFSVFNCIWFFLHVISPVVNFREMLAKIIRSLLLLFYIYQIVIFSKSEVRALFKDNCTVVY